MGGLYIVLSVLLIMVSSFTVVLILMQKKRDAGLGGSGIGQQGQTYWDKNKGRSAEGALEKYTKISGACFLLLALIINALVV